MNRQGMKEAVRSALRRSLPEVQMRSASYALILARQGLERIARNQNDGYACGFVPALVREAIRVHDKLLSECRLGQRIACVATGFQGALAKRA